MTDKQRIYKLERQVKSLERKLETLAETVKFEQEQRRGLRSDLRIHGSAVVNMFQEHLTQRHPSVEF